MLRLAGSFPPSAGTVGLTALRSCAGEILAAGKNVTRKGFSRKTTTLNNNVMDDFLHGMEWKRYGLHFHIAGLPT